MQQSGKMSGSELKISVRNLVEFILRSGDITAGTAAGPDPEVMRLGSRMHRKLQKKGGKNYQAEVVLSHSFPCDGYTLTVEGRADGVITGKSEEDITIDEIKGTFRNLAAMREPELLHLAQAKCYAYFYACDHSLDKIGVRMTYVNLDTEDLRFFSYEFTFRELENFFEGVRKEYQKWADFQFRWRAVRQESIHRTVFPFPYRKGQYRLASDVYLTIDRGKILFIQAPTGVGKTLSVLFPAVKAVGENKGDRIFYLTAKTITRTVAAEAFDQLRASGLRYKTVIITAKEKICPMMTEEMERTPCDPETCPFARGHFDRINQALYELVTSADSFDREAILKAAVQYHVCPFELSLDLSIWTDAVICDYNYVFQPRAKLKRFFSDTVRGDYLFLVDEAHNLVARGRDMYSASVEREDFMKLRRALRPAAENKTGGRRKKAAAASDGQITMADLNAGAAGGAEPSKGAKVPAEASENLPAGTKEKGISPGDPTVRKLTRALDGVIKNMRAMQADCESYENNCRVMESPGTLPVQLMNLSSALQDFLDECTGGEVRDQARELYFEVGTFLDICDRLDEHYVIYGEILQNRHFRIRLFCVDPSANLQECLNRARSTIFFSATLLPIDYYKRLLSTNTDNYAVYAESVFDPSHLKILVGADTSSRYRSRTPQEYEKTAEYIRRVVRARKGNYLIFFSSYRQMNDVEELFEQNIPADTEVIVQSSGMREKEREEFLEKFSVKRDSSLVGFCVMGSSFSEGIDLKNEKLIGAVIVGTGLPMVSTEQNLLKNYYDTHPDHPQNRDGFRYAYICPGMNKVLQAAGRVIRTEEDRGVVVLLDSRFTLPEYTCMFPREWAERRTCTLNSVEEQLRDFWKLFPADRP